LRLRSKRALEVVFSAVVLFKPEDRERVRHDLLARAQADNRVVAAAVVGSEAEGGVDRFSDIDLTFGVRSDVPVEEVLADWTEIMRTEMEGLDPFDVLVDNTIYRVFLLPENLQVDLSFSAENHFGATGPRFHLLFGDAVEKPWIGQADPRELIGLAVHHALRARFAIERERFWQAEYWLSETRHHALALSCLGQGLEGWHGRTVDRLPPDLLHLFDGTLIRHVDADDLLYALKAASELLREAADKVGVLSEAMAQRLEAVMSSEPASKTTQICFDRFHPERT
jgi:hypothetical protein